MASVKISENLNVLKFIKQKTFSNFSLKEKRNSVTITPTLPFRIKFVNIGIVGYGPGNAAPIGIAVIGINNYVM
jgi:hypothetical protein